MISPQRFRVFAVARTQNQFISPWNCVFFFVFWNVYKTLLRKVPWNKSNAWIILFRNVVVLWKRHRREAQGKNITWKTIINRRFRTNLLTSKNITWKSNVFREKILLGTEAENKGKKTEYFFMRKIHWVVTEAFYTFNSHLQ